MTTTHMCKVLKLEPSGAANNDVQGLLAFGLETDTKRHQEHDKYRFSKQFFLLQSDVLEDLAGLGSTVVLTTQHLLGVGGHKNGTKHNESK